MYIQVFTEVKYENKVGLIFEMTIDLIILTLCLIPDHVGNSVKTIQV